MNRERSAMIDNYLFGKISNSELESFEQQLMTDDALIFEVAQRENELVDMYVGGKLDSSASEQFRASLSRFPARVKKLQNASLLREYIFEARPSAESAAREPWYRRLGFAFGHQRLRLLRSASCSSRWSACFSSKIETSTTRSRNWMRTQRV